jgi:hypothetical protein
MQTRPIVLTLLGAAAVLSAAVFPAVPAQAVPIGTDTATVSRSCDSSAQPGLMSCFALRTTKAPATGTMSAMAAPAGYGSADLRAAYKLTGVAASTAVVAIVDAYDNPKAESDLAVYRAQYGLPACTTANGCFRKVNQNGLASPLPAASAGWAAEISLDVDMVSAVCPTCRILLVEANSAYDTDLYPAVDRAVTMGAKYVSNSWGGGEYAGQTSDDVHFNHPGVAITASTGDNGTGASYPATSRYVTAVGGTSLSRSGNARGWTESAWSGTGSGCSAYDIKPTWQTVTTGCAKRGESDVSAVADPGTGVAVYHSYNSSGWAVYGGTSASAPIVAAIYALAGTPGANDYPAAYPYAHRGDLFDATSGSNGGCGPAMCTAGTGWDGPTGLGTPNGTAAFSSVVGAPSPVTVNSPGNLSGNVGTAVNLTLSASGGTGNYTWTALRLPTGLALDGTTGVISGSPTATGSFAVAVTASSGGQSGGASFTWTISPPSTTCKAAQLLGNGGLESGTAPWSATAGVVSSTANGESPRSGTRYAWLVGYGTTHTDILTQAVTIPANCSTARLTFWIKIGSADTGTVIHDTLAVKNGPAVLATYSNLNRTGYVQKSLNLSVYPGQKVTLTFLGTEDASKATSFVLDDIALSVG